MPDRAWYASILGGDASPFLRAAEEITAAAERNAAVIADPVEGYNPMHDLTAALADAVAARTGGLRLTYPLMAPRNGGEAWQLDDMALARKRAAIAAYTPLAEEAAALLHTIPQAMAEERLLPDVFAWPERPDPVPAYERIGAERAAAGVYGRTILYTAHVRPLALALRQPTATAS